MPTIEVSLKDIEGLIKAKLGRHPEQLEAAFQYVKAEVEEVDGDTVKLEMKDANRPELWSTEGVARALRPFFGSRGGIKSYDVKKGSFGVDISKKTQRVRPVIACAVVKDIKITDETLKQIIQLQEKLTMTFGRKRKEAAIGVSDFGKITPPVLYTTVPMDGIKFIPLDFDREMTPKQIMSQHPKGREYANLIEGYKEMPILLDAAKQVISMPPIINSNYVGKVTTNTTDLFVDVTGYDYKYVEPALNIVVAALAERGGKVESVIAYYPDGKEVLTPVYTTKKMKVDREYLNRMLGVSLSNKELLKLVKQMGHNAKIDGKHLHVEYSNWRQDIMHPADLLEDIAIAYGYNDFKLEPLEVSTLGGNSPEYMYCKKVRDLMTGFRAQEISTFTLTSKKKLFDRMNLLQQDIVELENPMSENMAVLRNWLLPSAIEFLSRNTSSEYPQQVFDVGDCTVIDKKLDSGTRTIPKLTYCAAGKAVNFTLAKQILQSVIHNLGHSLNVAEIEHPSFIEGRVGDVKIDGKSVGIIGEIHPKVLNNWGISMPVVSFEIDLSEIEN